MTEIDFSANKTLAGRFFNNLSGDILDHHTMPLSVVLRFTKIGRLNSVYHEAGNIGGN